MAGIPVWVIVLVTLTAIGGGYLYSVYVNTAGSVEEGKDAIGIVAATLLGSFNEGPILVGLNNGYTAIVYWDGKAVGVVAATGKYIEVRAVKYYVDYNDGYGIKAQNDCPWHAFLTGATLYDVRRVDHKVNFVTVDGPDYVVVEYSNELKALLEANNIDFSMDIINGKLVILIPVYSIKYTLYGKFEFYYGSTGFLGDCPTLGHHYTEVVYGEGMFMSTTKAEKR